MGLIKRNIRKFSLWLNNYTRTWVISRETYLDLSEGRLHKASRDIEASRKLWKSDPEITKVGVLLRRYEDNINNQYKRNR